MKYHPVCCDEVLCLVKHGQLHVNCMVSEMIVIVIVSEIKLVKIYSQILFLILCDSFLTELKVRKRNVIGIHFLLVSSFSQLRRKR